MMQRPVCVSCCCEMRAEKNDRRVLLHFDAPPVDTGEPYQLWSGDEYRCPRCGVRIITGWGRDPISERYQEGFEATYLRDEEDGNLRHVHRNPIGADLVLTQDVIDAIRPVIEQRHANLVNEARLDTINKVERRIHEHMKKAHELSRLCDERLEVEDRIQEVRRRAATAWATPDPPAARPLDAGEEPADNSGKE